MDRGAPETTPAPVAPAPSFVLERAGLDPDRPGDRDLVDLLPRLRDLSRAVARFDGDLRDHARVNPTDFQAVSHLAHHGAMPVSRLGELLGLSSAATTAVVDRLEASGHADRVRDERDRRRVLVTQTADSRALIEGRVGQLVASLVGDLRGFEPAELAAIAKFCDLWLIHLDEQTEGAGPA